eukprot:gnl/Trimastix_PCT/1786.p1 GENE.gnl/Trimastix_PCT/1786~~gnl/Trimastix_PCT/1786.p1  ORF type:complete len:217 (-),score=36.20 gnl/Trimastix_PCT/1786:54-671(-)
MRMRSAALFALFALLCAIPAYGLQFELEGKDVQEFVEDMPSDTLCVVDFDALPPATFPIDLHVQNPHGDTMQYKKDIMHGKLAFTSQQAGDYAVVFESHGSRGQKRRIDVRIRVGIEAIDYKKVAVSDGLDRPLDVTLRQMEDKSRWLLDEVHYMRVREEEMRNTSESTCARVSWISILSLVLIVFVGTSQIVYLRHFFYSKKIV